MYRNNISLWFSLYLDILKDPVVGEFLTLPGNLFLKLKPKRGSNLKNNIVRHLNPCKLSAFSSGY